MDFLRKGILNQTDGENLSARYRFVNANTIFCLVFCFSNLGIRSCGNERCFFTTANICSTLYRKDY